MRGTAALLLNPNLMPDWYYKDKILVGQTESQQSLQDLSKAGSGRKINPVCCPPAESINTNRNSLKKTPIVTRTNLGSFDSPMRNSPGLSNIPSRMQTPAKHEPVDSFAKQMFDKLKSEKK